jgi:hypothetical protein
MPPITTYPIINGHAYSFASVEIWFGLLPLPQIAFKSINYGAKLDPGEIRGTDPHVLGYTRGTHSADGDCEVYRQAWEILKSTLGAGGLGYGEVLFTIVVQYFEVGSPVVRDRLMNIRLTESRQNNQQGNDGTTTKLTMKMMDVDENGGRIAVPIIP